MLMSWDDWGRCLVSTLACCCFVGHDPWRFCQLALSHVSSADCFDCFVCRTWSVTFLSTCFVSSLLWTSCLVACFVFWSFSPVVKCRACVSAVLRCSVHFSSDEMQGRKSAYFSRGVVKAESYAKRLIFHWFSLCLVTLEKKLQNRCSEDGPNP